MSETIIATPAGGAPARDWLPAEYQTDKAFDGLADANAVFKSYKNAASLIGVPPDQVVKLPKDETAPEWAAVYDRLGRPKDPAGYEIKAEGDDKPLWDAAAAKFHELGLTKRQVAGIQQLVGGIGQQAQANLTPDKTVSQFLPKIKDAMLSDQFKGEAEAALKKEFGQAYDEKLHAANAALKMVNDEMGGELGKLLIEQTGLANHPVLVRAFALIGSKLAEPTGLQGGGTGQMGGAITPAQANQQIAAMMADKEFFADFSDKNRPGYAIAKQKWDAAHAALAG